MSQSTSHAWRPGPVQECKYCLWVRRRKMGPDGNALTVFQYWHDHPSSVKVFQTRRIVPVCGSKP